MLFTSESVTEGHPDKVCDQISDAVLDAVLAEDPDARVACETSTTTGLVIAFGEITTSTYVDVQALVRAVVSGIAYNPSTDGFDASQAGVIVAIKEQSPDVAGGVDTALEGRGDGSTDRSDITGGGDQGMMIGYAANERPPLMPL